MMMKKKSITISDDGGTMDSSLWSRLPPETIYHVLSLLPLKSLCRFKSISPSWNTLISSAHSHSQHHPQTLKNPSCFPSRALYSVDLAQENPTAKKLGFPISNSRRKKKDSFKWIAVTGSCNGLVLISDQDNSNFLFNPFTEGYKKLRKSPYSHIFPENGIHFLLSGLGYDSSTDNYKVLILLYREFCVDGNNANVAVYSLKTDAWNIIQVSHFDYPELYPGLYFTERLHWLCMESLDGSMVVAAFDLSNEVFRKIKLPGSYDNSDYYDEFEDHHMKVLGGCLCLVVRPDESKRTGVWMMRKYGVRRYREASLGESSKSYQLTGKEHPGSSPVN